MPLAEEHIVYLLHIILLLKLLMKMNKALKKNVDIKLKLMLLILMGNKYIMKQ